MNEPTKKCRNCPNPAVAGKMRCEYHLAKLREYAKRHYQENKEKRRAHTKAWREKNKDRRIAYDKAYRTANAGRIATYHKAYAEKNPLRIALKYVRTEERRGTTGSCSLDQLAARFAVWGNRCWICHAPWTGADHTIPVAKGGTNWPANLRPCCISCNMSKNDREWRTFLAARRAQLSLLPRRRLP